MRVRLADEDDMYRLWKWVNDPTTRSMFIDTGHIPWDDHVRWYRKLMNDSTRKLLIGEIDRRPIGVVRFDYLGDCAEVSITVAPAARGRQLARALLDAALAHERPHEALAHVRPENEASLRLFSHWDRQGMAVVRGVPVLRFHIAYEDGTED